MKNFLQDLLMILLWPDQGSWASSCNSHTLQTWFFSALKQNSAIPNVRLVLNWYFISIALHFLSVWVSRDRGISYRGVNYKMLHKMIIWYKNVFSLGNSKCLEMPAGFCTIYPRASGGLGGTQTSGLIGISVISAFFITLQNHVWLW